MSFAPDQPFEPDAPFHQRVGALIRRERATRFPGGAIGYLWAYLTPVSFIFLIVIFFKIIQRTTPINVPVVNRPLFAGGSKVSMDGAYGKK